MDFGAAKQHHHTPTCSDVSAKFSDPMQVNVDAGNEMQQQWEQDRCSYDWSYQKSPTMLGRALTREREARGSPPTPTNEQFIVKTPEDFESYNLQNMERYRASAQARRSSEVARALSGGGRASRHRHENSVDWQQRQIEPESGFETGRSWLSLGR